MYISIGNISKMLTETANITTAISDVDVGFRLAYFELTLIYSKGELYIGTVFRQIS